MMFIARMRFWLVLGLAVLGGVVLLAFAGRAIAANSGKVAGLQKRRKELGDAANDLRNQADIKNVEALGQDYQGQLEDVHQLLLERDRQLERVFTEDARPDGAYRGESEPLGYGRWKPVCEEMRARLVHQLKQSVLKAPREGLLAFGPLPEQWPTVDDMHWREKRYWIQEAVVSAIARLNVGRLKKVPVFRSFRFSRETPDYYMHPAHEQPRRGEEGTFRVFAFTLEVSMKVEHFCLLLQELLDTEIGLEITGWSVRRAQTAVEGTAAARSPVVSGWEIPTEREERRPELSELVDVKLWGYAPDYLGPGEKTETETEEKTETGTGAARTGGLVRP